MSIRAMTWAWTAALSPTPKLVLMALADIADDQGLCWPSVKALARKCSLSERSVQRVLRSLESEDFLSVEAQFRKDGSRSSNRYRLALDALPPQSALIRAARALLASVAWRCVSLKSRRTWSRIFAIAAGESTSSRSAPTSRRSVSFRGARTPSHTAEPRSLRAAQP